MSIRIYGASDDLIEVEGDVREEFTTMATDGALVGTSNGALLRVRYTDAGTWRIQPVAGAELADIKQCAEDDEDNYSDVATVGGDVSWVLFGSAWVGSRSAGNGRRVDSPPACPTCWSGRRNVRLMVTGDQPCDDPTGWHSELEAPVSRASG